MSARRIGCGGDARRREDSCRNCSAPPHLSPAQAKVDLALPPNRGAYDAVIGVDLAGLRSAGYEITEPVIAARKYGLPGGGIEMQVRSERIPPWYVELVKKWLGE